VSSPDYIGIGLDDAVFDFKQRIESMKCEYETIDEDRDRDLSFIKIYNQGEKYLVNRVQGMTSSRTVVLAVLTVFMHCFASLTLYISVQHAHGVLSLEACQLSVFLHQLFIIIIIRSLRQRTHNKALLNKSTQLNHDDLLIRMLYKDSY